MQRNLWIVVLLLVAGSNSLVPEICAAHCMAPVATSSAHHHHQMSIDAETQPARESAKHMVASERQTADCVQCAFSSGYRQSLTSSCISLPQMEALKEVSFSLDEPRAAVPADMDQCSRHSISLRAGATYIFLDDPQTIVLSRTAAILRV